MLLVHQANVLRQRSVEDAVGAAICGAEAFTAASLGHKRDAVTASAMCLMNAGLYVVRQSLARTIDAFVTATDRAEWPETGVCSPEEAAARREASRVQYAEMTRAKGYAKHRRRAEDVH